MFFLLFADKHAQKEKQKWFNKRWKIAVFNDALCKKHLKQNGGSTIKTRLSAFWFDSEFLNLFLR